MTRYIARPIARWDDGCEECSGTSTRLVTIGKYGLIQLMKRSSVVTGRGTSLFMFHRVVLGERGRADTK